MSGGVDSTTAAFLLKQDYKVTGFTLIISDTNQSVADEAAEAAQKLKIPHIVIDIRKEFEDIVVSDFVSEYKKGHTPNPCVLCNREIKWKLAFEKVAAHGIDKIATGHYVINYYNEDTKRWVIRRGKDSRKDQSYFLWALSQKALSGAIFPLGNMIKDQVKEIAAREGLIPGHKRESQDICFLKDIDYKKFLEERGIRSKTGNIIDPGGEILAAHDGIHNFTIGQRRGLGIAAGRPVYVARIDPHTGNVTVGDRELLLSTTVKAHSLNFVKYEKLSDKSEFWGKIRYNSRLHRCRVVDICQGSVEVEFLEPVSGVTAGQSLVLYDDNDIALGGIIGK